MGSFIIKGDDLKDLVFNYDSCGAKGAAVQVSPWLVPLLCPRPLTPAHPASQQPHQSSCHSPALMGEQNEQEVLLTLRKLIIQSKHELLNR